MKLFEKVRSLPKYLWPVYVMVCVFVLATLVFSLGYVYRQLEASAFAETHSIAMAMDELNRRQLESMAIPLEAAFAEVKSHGGIEAYQPGELDELFAKTLSTLSTSRLRSFFAINRDGHFVGTSFPQGKPPSGLSFKGQAEFDYIRTQTRPTILSASTSPVDQQDVVILMKALRTPEGRFAGVIGVTKTVEQFERFFKSLDLPFGISFTMYRDDGKVLFRYPQNAQLLGKKVQLMDTMREATEGYVYSRAQGGDGTERIGYYKFSSEFGGIIYVGYNTEALYHRWNIICKFVAGFFIFFSVLYALGVMTWRRQQRSFAKSKAAQIRKENMIDGIQIATGSRLGKDFLQELCLKICEAFDIENVAIGVFLTEHSDALKFIVHRLGDDWLPESICDIRQTPFVNLSPGEFFICPQGAREYYAQDPILGDHQAESCMGIVLQDVEGRANGVILLYGRRELADSEMKRVVLSVFAARAGSELERIRTDEIRKEIERLRRQIEQRILQSEKLEAIGSLAQGIAHDFNNILAIILASADKLNLSHAAADPSLQYVDSIRKACHRARHLVAQIAIFSRRDPVQIRPIPMKLIFDEALGFLRSTIPAQINLKLDMKECADLMIKADLNQIQQAMMNLCVNASRQIGAAGGNIRITLKQTSIKDRRFVKWIVFSSADENERMDLEKSLDPFYSQNMGLVAVQRIITNHQGFFEIKSEPGLGTTFEIFLPLWVGPALEVTASPGYDFETAGKVMIVDDELEIGQLIKELLEAEGLRVDAFVDPVQALRAFRKNQSEYFMIISDLSMPVLSGFEFARQVRALNSQVSLIIWSGYQQFLDQELQDLNVQAISKPVDVQKLLKLIQAELSRQGSLDISASHPAPGTSPSALP
jgi:signal transduction histidine kinase/ActR/RegA family two-component response regulator